MMSESILQATRNFRATLHELPRIEETARRFNDVLLANLVMFSEIPAATFHEAERVQFFVDRLAEYGWGGCKVDGCGNGVGTLPGVQGSRNILVVAHMDTVHAETVDHTISVQADKIIGPGVGDNSLGVATLASIPSILDKMGIQLNANLVLVGAVQSLGRGNLNGLRYFLEHNTFPITAGLCIEGVQLGRLSYSSVGMLRGEIHCSVPEQMPWTGFEASGAIVAINEVINKLLLIPIPRRPKTSIILGSVGAGAGYNSPPTSGQLKFEIRCESHALIHSLQERVEEIVEEVASESEAEIHLDIFAMRDPGGVEFTHPLVQHIRKIMKELGIQPKTGVSISELSAFIDREIPAVTLGITKGEYRGRVNEAVYIDPMSRGVAQLMATLIAIDQGVCHES